MNNSDELIELDENEYLFLSEKFDIMSPDDVKELPHYIITSRKENFRKLVNLAIKNELDKTQAVYVIEKFFENRTISEIATAHGVSRQSVYRSLKNAGNRLFEVLKYAYLCGFSLLGTPQNLEELLRNTIKEEFYENN